MQPDPAILAGPQELDAYLQQVTARLERRWGDRCAFLEGAARRLWELRDRALALGDEEVALELLERVQMVRSSLATLRATGPGVASTPGGQAPNAAVAIADLLSHGAPAPPAPPPHSPPAEAPVIDAAASIAQLLAAAAPVEGPAVGGPPPVDEPAVAAAPPELWHNTLQRFWSGERLARAETVEEPSGPEPSAAEIRSPTESAVDPPAGLDGVPTRELGGTDGAAGDEEDLPPPPAPGWMPQPDTANDPSLLNNAGPLLGWDLNINVVPQVEDVGIAGSTERPTLRLSITIGDRSFAWTMPGDLAVLGRREASGQSRPDLDLWPDQAVSRQHARIEYRNGCYHLADLASANGTRLNDQDLRSGDTPILSDGDLISVGEITVMRVHLGQE